MSTLGCHNYALNQPGWPSTTRRTYSARSVASTASTRPRLTGPSSTCGHDPLGRCLKPKKDLNAPKRNPSSYMLFSASIREEVTKANPGLDMGAMSKLIGEKWATAGEEVKAEFQKKVEADKDRHQKEMDDYRYSHQGTELDGWGASNTAV